MDDTALRKELVAYLTKGRTHVPFSAAVEDMPEEAMNKNIEGSPHTPWMILEHIRISQHDMVDFSHNPDYKEIEWPKEYWPSEDQKADKQMWLNSVEAYKKDLELFKEIVGDPKNDLFAKIPWGEGQTITKEVLQVVDHVSYHLGQLVMVRKALGAWKKE